MMKLFFEESPPPSDCSKQASSSSSRESQTDQEMGPPTNTTSNINEDQNAQVDDTTFFCFKGGRNINYARMVVAELVGTFILVFCVCGIVASTQLMRGEVGLLEYAITGGFTIIVVIFSIGPISGAHVNPSITIAFATLGQFPWSKVPFYILAQILGSVLATYVGKSVYGIQADLVITQPLYGWKKAFWAELIATFIIMFLAASMSNEAKAVSEVSGLVVGVAISLAVLITGPVSGGSLNPARSLGPAIVSWRFDSIWLYVLAPTIGAVAGALLLCVLRLRPPICSRFSSPNTGGLLAR